MNASMPMSAFFDERRVEEQYADVASIAVTHNDSSLWQIADGMSSISCSTVAKYDVGEFDTMTANFVNTLGGCFSGTQNFNNATVNFDYSSNVTFNGVTTLSPTTYLNNGMELNGTVNEMWDKLNDIQARMDHLIHQMVSTPGGDMCASDETYALQC